MSDLYDYDSFAKESGKQNPIRYTKKESVAYISEHLASRGLNFPQPQSDARKTFDKVFHSNEEFWIQFLNSNRYYSFRNIVLEGFQIIDWFPRSPGLSFTLGAEKARKIAEKFFEPGSTVIYKPQGKEWAIKGGIGSYRFNPFEYHGTEYQLCTATTDSYCHTGLPLAVPLELLSEIDFTATYRIRGRYQPIADPLLQHFPHLSKLPRFYFIVEELYQTGTDRSPVWVTPVVFMQGKSGKRLSSYCMCQPDTPLHLDWTSVWLQEYALHYQAKILTDYDQQRPAFDDVVFSLQHVMAGEVDTMCLMQAGFTEKQATILTNWRPIMNIKNTGNMNIVNGDNYGTINAADFIRNLTYHVQSSTSSEEIRTLLSQLVESVDGLCKQLSDKEAQTVKRDLETFTKEAVSENPRKESLEISIKSIKKAAENLLEVGKPVLEIVSILMPLIISTAS